jgi:hypothetical protein
MRFKNFLHRPIFLGIFLGSFLGIFTKNNLYAQEPLTHEKKSYVDSLGRYYQQATLPVYLYISISPNQAPIPLSPTDSDKNKNLPTPIYLDGHGKHYIKHADALHNVEDKYMVYADGISPISSVAFSGASTHLGGGKRFYGKNLRLTLTTKDEMSGIQGLYNSLNKSAYMFYREPLDFSKREGEFDYKYYAVDNVGNVEKIQNSIFTVDLSNPITYHNIIGINSNGVISATTKIYLTPTDSIAGISRTFYKIDEEEERSYANKSVIPIAVLPDGEHTITYYSVDNVNNKEEPRQVSFYLDKSSPIMSADILGDRFIVGDKVYFSGRTKLKLTAVDNKAGVKVVFYSIDGGEYTQYNDPFYLPGKSGLHSIKYYAIDKVENQGAGNEARYDEYTHNVGQVYVDLTGPDLNMKYVGANFQKGDTTFISQKTKIQFNATDPESGLQRITFSIDGDNIESEYSQPFSILQSGFHKIDYFGYDNVNNRNIKDMGFIVDNTGPEVFATFSSPPIESETSTYPSFVSVFLAATDMGAGYEEIRYSLNGRPEVPYTGIIRGFEKNRAYRLILKGVDKLGNETRREINFKTGKY